MTQALRMEGLDVRPILDVKEDFLKLIDYHRPHIIMLDYRLESRLRKNICFQIKENYPHLPVIAVSCNYNIDRLYGEGGFDDYVDKPLSIDPVSPIII